MVKGPIYRVNIFSCQIFTYNILRTSAKRGRDSNGCCWCCCFLILRLHTRANCIKTRVFYEPVSSFQYPMGHSWFFFFWKLFETMYRRCACVYDISLREKKLQKYSLSQPSTSPCIYWILNFTIAFSLCLSIQDSFGRKRLKRRSSQMFRCVKFLYYT